MRMQRWLGRTIKGQMVRSLLFLYLLLNGFAFIVAERFIFQPPAASYQDTKDILKLKTADEATISALYLPQPKAAFTLIYSHGNGEDLGDIRSRLERLRTLGFAVFAYDYRGYGTSEGFPAERFAYQDINAAYQYVTETLKVPASQIVLYGRSVGSGPSVDLASREPVSGMILESPFISTFRVITHLPILPWDRFNNLAKLKSVRCSVLIMHGTRDRVIPYYHSQVLFTRFQTPKTLLTIENADHNDLLTVAGDRYDQAIRAFQQELNLHQSQAVSAAPSPPL